MSTTKHGLPTSLTPGVLEEALAYEPRHWKELRNRLARKGSAVWGDMDLSDAEFYLKLHRNLQDPNNRREFKRAARKNQRLDLYQRLLRHYEIDPDLVRENVSRKEIFDFIASYVEDDRLANLVWLFREENAIMDQEFSEIAREHPGVHERLGFLADDDGAEVGSPENQWAECLSRIRDTLEEAGGKGPDPGVVNVLASCVDQLRKIVSAEVERSAKFWSSFAELIREHRDVLSDQPSLKPYVDWVDQRSSSGPVPENASELLETLDGFLRSLAEVVGAIRVKSEAMAGADAEQRDQIVKEMAELSGNESKLRSDTGEVLSRLLPDVDDDAATDVSEARMGTSTTRTDLPARPTPTREEVATRIIPAFRRRDEERGTGGGPFDVDAEELEPADHGGLSDDPETDSQPPAEDSDVADESAGADVESEVGAESPTHEVGATEEASEGSDSPGKETSSAQDSSPGSPASLSGIVSASKVSTGDVPEGKAATSGSSLDAAPHRGDSPSPAESEVRAPGERTAVSSASDALDEMLSSGRFARAYWLTRADPTLGNPDLYGALAEGARIGPGDPCPGDLIHFYSGLAHKDHWLDDERLILSASVLGPCLFVDPLPQDIYQLANEFPAEGSMVGALMQKVRELCVYRNAKIRPQDLGVESLDAVLNARLDELASKAESFLHRVPHIRFLYAPADLAIRFVYRTGSEWHRLHTIVGGGLRNRLSEAQGLIELLDPGKVVATLHDETELGVLKHPLDGRARDKLARHLHDTLALAGEWCRLVLEIKNGGPSGNQSLSADLRDGLKRLLPAAREALSPHKGHGAGDALDFVLEDLDARVRGRTSTTGGISAPISGDLRLLPGVPLEDDLEPLAGDLEDLRRAILEAEESESDPNKILGECLDRQEYRRAREIIKLHQLGERAQGQYQEAVSNKRSTLESSLNELELEIEDAFLLGQLRDDGDQEDTGADQASIALERSQLLGVVGDARWELNQSSDSGADELRELSRRVDELATRTNEMTSRRRERLRREFHDLMERFPRTEQGETDRDYLREAFEDCVRGDDHVAAFDLLDRGRKAAQGMEAVVRATTGSSEDLDRFLKRADGYRETLRKPGWLARAEESIRQGGTFLEIAFGQLDRTRREEASNALRAWNSMMQIRFSHARRELTKSVEQLLRFLGLPLQAGGVHIVDTTEAGFAHVRVTLTRPVASSPLPAFGSACGNRFEIVIGQTRKEPEQFEEYIRGCGLAGRPVLAVLLLPQSPAYRIRWQRHFTRVRLTVFPLDLVFLFHLCGERNRLPVLFELGLPFTWTRPYITKGENVPAEMFVGRSDETATLMDPEGSCIVFGGRQLGKSALLRHVHRENHDPGQSIYVVYLDVDDLGTGSQGHDTMMAVFWRRVYAELLRYEAVPELPQKVLDRENRLIGEVPDSISTCLSKSREMRIVLLLDETDDLLDCDSGQDFALVRRLRGLMANSDRRFKVVFAGLHSVQRYYTWKNHPFAQLGKELVVNPLPPAAAQELIIRPLRALGFAFENTRLVLRILSQTNYHPGLIQITGYRLLENLFERWQRRDTSGPIREITSDDILSVERDDSIMEDIRNRFDWTLDLDDRYKVLTYALVLTPDPTAPRRESEFMAIGSDWWSTVFQTMDAQGLRAVLDEMVGLGVLLRENEDEAVRTYRLRSPNLLRLLGPQEAIEAELLRIIERTRVNRPNPRNFHPIIDRKPVAFGPLTNEQVGQIDGHRRPFHLTLITGSEALGLNDVERQFNDLLGEADKDNRGRAWKQIPYVGPMDADAFVGKFRESLKLRRRTHRFAVVRLDEIEYEGEPSALFSRLIRELGQLCTNDSKAHLVLLLDPRVSWQWLRDRNREQVLSQFRVTGLELRRWSDGAIANAFDRIDARTASQSAGSEVFRLTSGFHRFVNQGMSRVKPRSGANANTLLDEWETLCSDALADGGAESALRSLGLRGTDPELESCVWKVLRLREAQDGRPVLTGTSFDLAAEELDDSGRQWFEKHAVPMREWMRTMDLVRPLDIRGEGSMELASWVQDVIGASEG